MITNMQTGQIYGGLFISQQGRPSGQWRYVKISISWGFTWDFTPDQGSTQLPERSVGFTVRLAPNTWQLVTRSAEDLVLGIDVLPTKYFLWDRVRHLTQFSTGAGKDDDTERARSTLDCEGNVRYSFRLHQPQSTPDKVLRISPTNNYIKLSSRKLQQKMLMERQAKKRNFKNCFLLSIEWACDSDSHPSLW